MKPALFTGHVWHKRFKCASSPIENFFRYPVHMLAVDLEEAENNRGFENTYPFWSAPNSRLPSLGRWRRSDYFGDKSKSLSSCVRALAPDGMTIDRIIQLSNPAYFGFSFNPVSVYYCYQADTIDELVAVLLEVTNTPW
jgi:DUF1365 family protein